MTLTVAVEELHENNGILYLGASVTAQKEGYRPKLHHLICEHTGKKVPMHVDSLGGIGSMFGLASYRRNKHLFANDIGLIIFEYSTGDLNIGITPLKELSRILRAFFSELKCLCDNIVVLHNFRADFPNETDERVRPIYNKIADEYGIPVVSANSLVDRAIENSPNWLDEHYRDHVHPTSKGAELLAKWILDELIKNNNDTGRALPPPKVELAEFGYFDLNKDGNLHADGVKVYEATGTSYAYIEIHENQVLDLVISGEIWGLVMVIGPESCKLSTEIAGEKKSVNAFDRNCDYDRVHCFPFRASLPAPETLTLSQSSEKPDFSILTRPTSKTTLPRVLRIAAFIGENIELKGVRSCIQ